MSTQQAEERFERRAKYSGRASNPLSPQLRAVRLDYNQFETTDNIPMRAKQPHWQNYWYDLRFREAGTASFLPMGSEGLQQVSNQGLATLSLDDYVDRFLNDSVDELDDLHGELQMLVYTEATPGPDTEPVLVRTVTLGRR